MSNENPEFDWFTQERTYEFWTSQNIAGNVAWYVIELTTYDYPEDSDGTSYIGNATLYTAAGAGNPEEAKQTGDSEPINVDDLPAGIITELEKTTQRDYTADIGVQTYGDDDE